MKRYHKLVRQLDRMQASPEVVTIAIFGDVTWDKVLSAGRIYLEDGGQRLRWDDFAQTALACQDCPTEILGMGLLSMEGVFA